MKSNISLMNKDPWVKEQNQLGQEKVMNKLIDV